MILSIDIFYFKTVIIDGPIEISELMASFLKKYYNDYILW